MELIYYSVLTAIITVSFIASALYRGDASTIERRD